MSTRKKKNASPNIIAAIPLPNNKEFFQLQSKEFQRLYAVFSSLPPEVSSDPSAAAAALLAPLTAELHISPAVAPHIASALPPLFAAATPSLINPPIPTDPPKPKITVSLEDYQRFLDVVQADPTATPQTSALLLSFIIFYRRNSHPTGWVRYDKKNIFYLAGISSLSTRRQEKLTAYLHTHYDLDMQVVGSNQPIPCYNLGWIQSQPPIGTPSNPIITLGDLDPQTVRDLIAKTDKEVSSS